MKIINYLKKIFYFTKITLIYIHKLKKIKDDDYENLNVIKYNYTLLFLKFLNLETSVYFEDNIGNNIKDNNILFVINHKSLLDIVVVEHTLHHLKNKNINNFWIAKKELKKIFLLGKFFTEVKSNIFIDRNNPHSSKEMFRECKEVLKNGKTNICIFPEGTRNKVSNEILEFKKGADLLAKMNKMKIIPIYIEQNTNDLLNEDIKKEKRYIKVHIGKEINYDNLENNYRNFVNKVLKK